jgi:hypothetical protein
MSYTDQAGLNSDPEFNRRTSSALTTEGRAKVNDPLGKLIMNSPQQGVVVFMPFLSSAPGFADKYATGGQEAITDGDILSAVQASWADVTTVQGLGAA